MSQPIIMKAAEALQQYGLQALIGSQVVFVSEVLGDGSTTLKAGVIIDDSDHIMPFEPSAWEKSVLCVEVVEGSEERLYPIAEHEQLVILPGFISYVIEPLQPIEFGAVKEQIQAAGGFKSLFVNAPNVELTHQPKMLENYPLVNHLIRQMAFSRKAFGPGRRTAGIIQHIGKELNEVSANPYDIYEWIDIVLLALDGAWRHVKDESKTDEQVAHIVASALQAKLARNELRTWPDWRLVGEKEAIEHHRGNEFAETRKTPRNTTYPAGSCKHGPILYGNECLQCTREAQQGKGGAA